MGFMSRLMRMTVFVLVVAGAFVRAADESALGLARRHWARYGKTVSKISLDCLSWKAMPDPDVPGATAIDVLEKHDARCGGDPQTAPTVAYLRVDKGRIYLWNAGQDRYLLWTGKRK